MDWLWESLRTIAVGALTFAIGAAVVWVARAIRSRIFGPRAVMRIERTAGLVALHNLTRHTLWQVSLQLIDRNHGRQVEANGDLPPGGAIGTDVDLEVLEKVGSAQLMWIDRERQAVLVELPEGWRSVDVVPKRERRRWRIVRS